ncbi:mandelate racemase/muconate lactonizing enzyme family protein [candidate division KSB1 bacterium]|nr:mandelate racemase/muconate lactonizing enzyme family protein [candidate division KSB1 bacterium]RQW06699.1 MAG: mandelate racemase/muconate lactonizing enzyme family protein [candidate division KSB1 bacterium]
MQRRQFIQSAFSGATFLAVPATARSFCQQSADYSKLDEILSRSVLKRDLFDVPIIIDTLELLRYQNNFICRVRSSDGSEGLSISNNMQMVSLYPIFINRLQPFFINKDARDLDELVNGVYVFQSNYKLQNLALWVPLATIEFAILDLLGRIAGKSLGELIGDIHARKVAVYQANNYRGKTAEESIELIVKQVEETKAKALKFKVGGRMSNNADDPPGRTEKLIPLVRKAFGGDMVIYADANGSYTADEAIRIGRLMEDYEFDFYEEPVPFDWYEETKEVADALSIPIAGGEQEPSLHNFRWLIGNRALDIVQPDIFYFGGMIRTMKVALMAHAFGLPCVPHISGSGLGYLYMMHFVSAIPNAGPYHEFKGFNMELPFECATSSLTSENGIVSVPTGPGLGIEIDPDFIQKHRAINVQNL